MSVPEMLYKLIMGPLELLFDSVYAIVYQRLHNPGLSLVFLSLTINLLVLPLYRRADALQEEERRQTLKMKPVVDHIKRVFKGDQRFMLLQTYYRQNHYKPYYVLKSSLSLLLEIPFFIAAYRYLSGLQLLQGQAFGPIADLGAPDGLLHLAGRSINVLPVLMTAINLVSGAIYTRGMPIKSKLQLYGMAAVFLVLLYRSPSGLVLYWTLNNLFSLGKNLVYRLPRRKRRSPRTLPAETPVHRAIYIACAVLMTLLTGLMIPAAVVSASPAEFADLSAYRSPLQYLPYSFLLAAGTFLVWMNIFYKLATPGVRRLFSLGMAVACAVSLLDFMAFGKGYGNMSSLMQYDLSLAVPRRDMLINAAALAALAGLVYLLWKRKPTLTRAVAVAGCLAVAGMSGRSILAIHADAQELARQAQTQRREAAVQPVIPLDQSGKNVVVIMLDRAISGYIPYILQEKPELQRQFAGFTYYPNTISYGAYTNVGTPCVYGGYEYIPEEMNRRGDTPLMEKQNEALKLMPLNFLDSGYEVTVFDPPYANYKETPDLSIFDETPEIHACNTFGVFTEENERENAQREHIRQRNLYYYSLFRSAPLLIHGTMYNNGMYNEADIQQARADNAMQMTDGLSRSHGVDKNFIKAYDVLRNLGNITEFRNTGKNTFFIMSNIATHDVMLLQEPEYEPAYGVDNTAYDAEHALRTSLDGQTLALTTENAMVHYHANAAALLQLGRWFDTLRENGAWDNTRIIVVSDHGRNLGLFNLQMKDSGQDMMFYVAVMMVKDFGDQTFRTDDAFMTVADTPTLAFAGLIDHPVNKITGKPVTDMAKDAPEQHVLFTKWSIRENCGNTFLEGDGSHWFTLRNQNLFDMDNWTMDK